MRIVNVLPDPRHYSYASTASGGKTLKSGEISPELPLSTIHNQLMWKDIATVKIQLQLSDSDREFIAKLLVEADKPISVKTRPKPVKPVIKKKPKSTQSSMTAKPEIKSEAVTLKPITKEALKAGAISLRDLRNNNAAGIPVINAHKSTLKEIETHMGGRI